MKTISTSHPSSEVLAAYEQAMLPAQVMRDVEGHLLCCDSCCRRLEARVDPDFEARLREAARTPGPDWTPGNTPKPAQPNPEPGTLGGPSGERPHHRLVREALADHPRYKLGKVLDEGGMGVVFVAEHRLMGRKVALKAVKTSSQGEEAMLARFQREVRASARLSHRNIVTAFDAEQVGSMCFLVMEFVEGEDLSKRLRRCGPLPVREACGLAVQAALALQHLHEQGLIHRDVKPQNLIVTPEGTVKLLDFGLARVMWDAQPGAALTQADVLLGTPTYMAPEQAFSPRTADIRADVYSLGCTLYQLLAGQPPFVREEWLDTLQAHLMEQPTPLRETRADVPAKVEAVVAKMLAKEPAERYQTPGEAAEALRASFAKEARGKEEPRRRRWRWPVAAAVLLGGVLGLVAAGAVYTIRTAEGEVEIETVDPKVQVTISDGGKVIEIMDGETRRKVRLAAGRFRAELKDAPGLELETNEFELKRGGTVVVKVRRKPPPEEKKTPANDDGAAPPPTTGVLKEWFAERRVSEDTKPCHLLDPASVTYP
jgi:hypothetical protein